MPAVAHIRLLPDPLEVDSRLAELGPVSPELALVDPELARAVRALLPERAFHRDPKRVAPMLAPTIGPASAAGSAAVPIPAVAPGPAPGSTPGLTQDPTVGSSGTEPYSPFSAAVASPLTALNLRIEAPPDGTFVLRIEAPPAGTFVLRHFIVGIVLGLLIGALLVEGYMLLDPLRSSSTSSAVATTPELQAPSPNPTTVPTLADPSSQETSPAVNPKPPASPSSPTTTTRPVPTTTPPTTTTTTTPPTPTTPTTPPPPLALAPPAPPRVATVFSWPAEPGAARYRVTLTLRGRRVFARTVRTARLPLPVRWRFAGTQYVLRPGTYRWIVTPLRRVGTSLRPGAAIVDAQYVVPRTLT